MTPRELTEVVQLVRAVARTAIVPRFRNLAAGDVSEKSGPSDLVTIADEEAEALLATGFVRLFPGCTVVGEEAATRDPAVMDAIGTAPLCFVVDPIDGTFNFASGVPLFGVMVAVVEQGRTVAAVIHEPLGDETAVALAGQGAWNEARDGTRVPLRVAAAVPVGALTGTLSWHYMPEPLRTEIRARMHRVGYVWDYRCAAHQYRLLAAGHCHLSVYGRTLPWDHAAGVLLHHEAGGYAARPDGRAYVPAEVGGGLICAPDAASWAAVRTALFEG